MARTTELAIVRRAYAKQLMAAAGVVDRRVEAAFAAVDREDFLRPGPGQAVRWGRGYVPTPGRDPVFLYDDVVGALIPERDLNNGQPFAFWSMTARAARRILGSMVWPTEPD